MGHVRLASAVVALGVMASPAIASAEGKGSCPPGSWFCADAPGVSPGADDDVEPAGETGGEPRPGSAVSDDDTPKPSPRRPRSLPAWRGAARGDEAPPPIVVYEPAPPKRHPRVIYVTAAPPPPPPPSPPRARRPKWGLQFRLEGVMMGSNRASDASMGGAGLSLRARPTPHFALDFGLDALAGTDFAGNRRSEGAFTVNPMLFVNPRSAVQLYFLAGLGFSRANVTYGDQSVDHFGYFGIDGGVGVEFRLTRRIALDVDVVGFVRERTDRGADARPEFTDPTTGRTTNASGGGLGRVGLGFYW